MRVVIKVGSNLLTAKDGRLDSARIRDLVEDIAELKAKGHEAVLVTSGAISAGMGKLRLTIRPSALKEKQALAAIGQPLLMDMYKEYFDAKGITIAQLLLTRQDFSERQNYLNARNTLFSLLAMDVVPVINENDTIAVEEINFGENDTLAALVAAKISAEYLVLLTDVDGFYKGVPGKSELFTTVEKITDDIERCALSTSSSSKGSGGMKSKIAAAKIAAASGVTTVIANGLKKGVVQRIAGEERPGTVFLPKKQLEARKCWIAFGARCSGTIVIDEGAVAAVRDKKKSLLPSGILKVSGDFKVGDTVSITDVAGKEIARGLTYYASEDVEKIKKKKSAEIKKILAEAHYEEVVHRDNLVVL